MTTGAPCAGVLRVSPVHRYEIHGRFRGKGVVQCIDWRSTEDEAIRRMLVLNMSQDWKALRIVLLMEDNSRRPWVPEAVLV